MFWSISISLPYTASDGDGPDWSRLARVAATPEGGVSVGLCAKRGTPDLPGEFGAPPTPVYSVAVVAPRGRAALVGSVCDVGAAPATLPSPPGRRERAVSM